MSVSGYIKQLRAMVGNMPLMIPAVAAVILNADGMLLLQQKKDGSWSLPAGMIEPGESPLEAISREVKEETGYNVIIERVLGIFGGKEYGFTYPNGDRVEYTIILFKCRIYGDEQCPFDSETSRLDWFTKSTLPKLSLPYPLECLFAETPDIVLR